ncbi:MAG: ribosome maturation factor RimP [Clostridiales bacterium]|jgi:ribosome maturation factor RimP|nr:ribosome maturation factor RimP [Clostridiales bacterium]
MAKNEVCSRIQNLLDEFLEDKQLETYLIQFKKEGPEWKLKVFLDKPEGADAEYVGIDECEEVTRFINAKLDEDDFIDQKYVLEVSSPGLDRELIKDSDYRRFKGSLVEVKLYEQINGNKNYEGKLVGKENDVVTVELEDGSQLELPENKISKINLSVVF